MGFFEKWAGHAGVWYIAGLIGIAYTSTVPPDAQMGIFTISMLFLGIGTGIAIGETKRRRR